MDLPIIEEPKASELLEPPLLAIEEEKPAGLGLGAAGSRFLRLVWPYISSTGMVVVATGVSRLLEPIVLPSNLSLVYLTAVLFSALRYGLWPSILASLLSELSLNFFFMPPKYSLDIDNPQDLLALILFFVVALAVSNLVALKIKQSEAIEIRARMTTHLYIFGQTTAGASSLNHLMRIAVQTIGSMLHREVVLLLPHGAELRLHASYPEIGGLDTTTTAGATLAYIGAAPIELGSETNPGEFQFFPLRTSRGVIGVIGARKGKSDHRTLDLPDEQRLLSILIAQTAVAIERMQLAESVDQARLEAETERLRSAMLTSVSHDLRTPLTTIIAAHSMLKSLGDSCDSETRSELVDRAQDEAERLNRFIGNLLDMTRLESGKIDVKLGPIEIAEAVEAALIRAAHLIERHKLRVEIPPDLPMVTADFLLMEQVLFNLIDNASKYAPPDTTIGIRAKAVGPEVTIQVVDEGPGIPEEAFATIFDKFARLRVGDGRPPGTGLGLSICRGFLAAMGGAIVAGNRTDQRGALFTIGLPLAD